MRPFVTDFAGYCKQVGQLLNGETVLTEDHVVKGDFYLRAFRCVEEMFLSKGKKIGPVEKDSFRGVEKSHTQTSVCIEKDQFAEDVLEQLEASIKENEKLQRGLVEMKATFEGRLEKVKAEAAEQLAEVNKRIEDAERMNESTKVLRAQLQMESAKSELKICVVNDDIAKVEKRIEENKKTMDDLHERRMGSRRRQKKRPWSPSEF